MVDPCLGSLLLYDVLCMLQEAESNLEAARKKIRNCQRREQRAKQNCKFLVDDLYNKNMIIMELRSKLDSYGGKLKG